jgi:hypothetical protein
LEVVVNGVLVPFTSTCTAVMSGIEAIGTVTVTGTVVPVWPDAVKLRLAEFATRFVIVAGVVTAAVHPVPHEVVVVMAMGTFTVRDSVLGAVPVVPVTTTVKPEAGNGLQLTERTAPENDAVHPAGTVPAVNVTVPVNPLIPVTEMVEVPAVPAVARAILDGLAANEKS